MYEFEIVIQLCLGNGFSKGFVSSLYWILTRRLPSSNDRDDTGETIEEWNAPICQSFKRIKLEQRRIETRFVESSQNTLLSLLSGDFKSVVLAVVFCSYWFF